MSAPIPARIPVFPLPEVVFYPRTNLPLHVFEPRYRQMVAEALHGDRVLGVVLLKAGWQEDYFASPETYQVGCAGRMEDVVRLPDGRYHLRLEAVCKMEILRFERLTPYRIAQVRPLDEREPDDAEGAERAKGKLLAAYISLAAAVAGRPVTPFTFDSTLDHALLVNLACMHLGIDVEEKQRLLELHDVAARGRRITAMLERELHRVLTEQRIRGDDGEESVH